MLTVVALVAIVAVSIVVLQKQAGGRESSEYNTVSSEAEMELTVA